MVDVEVLSLVMDLATAPGEAESITLVVNLTDTQKIMAETIHSGRHVR